MMRRSSTTSRRRGVFPTLAVALLGIALAGTPCMGQVDPDDEPVQGFPRPDQLGWRIRSYDGQPFVSLRDLSHSLAGQVKVGQDAFTVIPGSSGPVLFEPQGAGPHPEPVPYPNSKLSRGMSPPSERSADAPHPEAGNLKWRPPLRERPPTRVVIGDKLVSASVFRRDGEDWIPLGDLAAAMGAKATKHGERWALTSAGKGQQAMLRARPRRVERRR